jgi:hypothetical protein
LRDFFKGLNSYCVWRVPERRKSPSNDYCLVPFKIEPGVVESNLIKPR